MACFNTAAAGVQISQPEKKQINNSWIIKQPLHDFWLIKII